MNIEQRLTGTIRSFRLGALVGALLLNVGRDVVLPVLNYTTSALLHRCLSAYATTTPGTLRRRFLSGSGNSTTHRDQITVRHPAHRLTGPRPGLAVSIPERAGRAAACDAAG